MNFARFNMLASPILALPRTTKRVIAVLSDIAICIFTVWFAFFLRLGEFVPMSGNALWAVAASIVFSIPIFHVFGLYRAIFRYSGWPALVSVTRAVAIYGLLYAAVFTAISLPNVPRTVGLIQPILLLLLVGGSRILVRLWLGGQYESILRKAARPRVLIYGAGPTGRDLANALANSRELRVVGFVDDDRGLYGTVLNGLPVFRSDDLESVTIRFKVVQVLLAMPEVTRKRRNEILAWLRERQISVRTLPSMTDLAQGRVTVSDLRELEIDDLLGRDPVEPDQELLTKKIRGRVVLVTGAGGSIGSELCRQIMTNGPQKLLLVDQSEFALYLIHQELERRFPESETSIFPLLANVNDKTRMEHIMRTWRPETVYHAAAYKHVPLVEHNPGEGVRNNVFGTMLTAQIAAQYGVKDFVLVSTDKAVRPTNIMGASKRLAEAVLQALSVDASSITFSMVRFGNVLGSSGSVVPKFRQQIHEGGPITLTHAEITRYFMTVPEAAQLVIQAGAMAKGGDVFVLDMGEPVRIYDLAKRMVELSGLTLRDELTPDGDIEIRITGLRPGEKLYEELLIGDNPEPTSHSRIMKAHEKFTPWCDIAPKLDLLASAIAANEVSEIHLMMKLLVPEYTRDGEIVDWIYGEQASLL